jgi:Na+/proline symporter
MTLRTNSGLRSCLAYYYLWYVLFSVCTFLAGLTTRIIIPDTLAFDPELALPTVALQLLPPVMVGLVLAGIFAATMSTADSQILSCSAAISRDIFGKNHESYWKTKLTTILITIGALMIALSANESVFSLVLVAWSGLGASFVPIVLTAGLGVTISSEIAVVAGMLAGFGTVVVWRWFDLNSITYEVLPGIACGCLTLVLCEWLLKKRRSQAS